MFIVIGAIIRQVNILLLLSGLMAGAFLLNWRLAAKMLERVKVRRRIPPSVPAGQPLVVVWELENQREQIASWSIRFLDVIGRVGADDKRERRASSTAETLLSQVPPGETAQARYRCWIYQRGIYRLGPATVNSRFPFGLVNSKIKVPTTQTIVVSPRPVVLTQRWKQLTSEVASGTASRQTHRNAGGGDFHRIREWQIGDQHRAIHWRSSAKRGDLMVKEYESDDQRRLCLVLDLWGMENASNELEEQAVSFMASAISDLAKVQNSQSKIGLMGDETFVTEGRVDRQCLEQHLERLATLQASAEPETEAVLSDWIEQRQPWNQWIVVSTRPMQHTRIHDLLSRQTLVWIDLSSAEGQTYFRQKEEITLPAENPGLSLT